METTYALPTDREALLSAIRADPQDRPAWLAYADWLQENGRHDEAGRVREEASRTAEEGDRCVTVGRDGASHDRHGNGIYTTKVYEAARRARDGVLTWRLVSSLRGHRTSGKRVTDPMTGRAKAYAAEEGLPYVAGVTHGTVCRHPVLPEGV